jgi:hypothetical protein
LPEDEQKKAAAKMGLLNFGAQMLANANQGFGGALGTGLLGGAQGYQGSLENQTQEKYRAMQIGQLEAKNKQEKSRQDVFGRIASNPGYQLTQADAFAVDPESALKAMIPGAVDYGLEPKVGIHPTTGKTAFFVQDKRGGTKWLDASVPPDFQLVPGTDYKPAQVFDRRGGRFADSPAAQTASAAPVATPSAFASPAAPADQNAPWSRITSPAKREEMQTETYKQAQKTLEDLRARVAQGRQVKLDLDRFGELNREQGTGGLWDNIPYIPTTDPQKREMQSIVARLAPAQRPAGSGTTSDKDIELYLKGLPGVDKPGPVNKNIRDQYYKQLTDAENSLAFYEQYMSENGHLNGVEEARRQAVENGKTGGLDTSTLSPEQAEMLRQADPAAFKRGTDRQEANNKNLLAEMPKPAAYKGKRIKDHQTGKILESNGLQWKEVR